MEKMSEMPATWQSIRILLSQLLFDVNKHSQANLPPFILTIFVHTLIGRVMISLCFLSLHQCIWCLALESIKVLLDNLKIFQTKLLLVAWETPIYRSSFSTNFFVRAESPVRAVTSAVVWQKNLMKCQSAICRVWHLSLCSSGCHNRIITNNNVQLGFKYHQPCSGEVLSVFGRENGGVLA